MGSTSTKIEALRSVIAKAGIPIAISVASFIFARMVMKKRSIWKASSSSSSSSSSSLDNQMHHPEKDLHQIMHRDQESFHELDHIRVERELEEEISGMRSRIEELQERVWEQEMRFIHYHDLKEREVMLMELHNKLLMEIRSIEFLERAILCMEAESQRIGDMVIDYLNIMELLEVSRSENKLLHKRVKKLLRKMKGNSRLLKDKSMQIEAKEAEISRNHEELETKVAAIQKLEDEIRELQMAIQQLQSEKHELMNRIDLAERSASVKIEGEVVSKDDYNKLAYELEQLQEDREAETKELIFLRWCHACLRHELTRRNQEQQEEMEVVKHEQELHLGEFAEFGSDNEVDGSSLGGHGESCLGFSPGGHVHGHSRRKKLIEKLKRWVDGSEKLKQKSDEKEKHEHNKRGADNLLVPARKSCSSA